MDFKVMKRVGTLAMLMVFLVSCGGAKNTITDVKIDQTTVDEDSFLHLSAKLDLGNIYLPSFKGPILIPSKGEIGEIELGADFVEVDLNLSEILPQLQTGGALPNGAKLPFIKDNPVVTLPIKGSNIEVYVSLANGAPVIGVSIPIKELDQIGIYSAFFPAFKIDKILAAGGVYSSEVAGESGIGAFFDLSGVIKLNDGSELKGNEYQYYPMAMGAERSYQLGIHTETTSRRAQRRIDKVLYRLHRKRKTVDLY